MSIAVSADPRDSVADFQPRTIHGELSRTTQPRTCGAAALLNAGQAAVGPTDEGQWEDRPYPSSRRWPHLWLAYPDATSAVYAKLIANMSHQQWR